MLLAMAVLLLHPQLAATAPLTLNAKGPAIAAPAASSDSPAEMAASPIAEPIPDPVASASAAAGSDASAENSAVPKSTDSAEAAEPQPEAALNPEADVIALPDAPAPVLLALASPGPMAFVKSGRPMTVSVAQLQAEDRRKEMLWKGLTIATSSAAMFDAVSTRHAITTYGAVELNPLLRPFAGNSSLF